MHSDISFRANTAETDLACKNTLMHRRTVMKSCSVINHSIDVPFRQLKFGKSPYNRHKIDDSYWAGNGLSGFDYIGCKRGLRIVTLVSKKCSNKTQLVVFSPFRLTN